MPTLSSALADQTLTVLENAFRRLEQQVPPPVPVPFKDSFVLRYTEKTIEQALVQKLARAISGLHAARLLNVKGFVQEQGVIQRTIDELNEDIAFLAAAITNDTVTDRHRDYLEAFYEEEFNPADGKPLKREKRYMTPRKKIQAYVDRILGGGDVAGGLDSANTLSKAYSGFVHAASPHIMDMCLGSPPRFRIAGLLGTPRVAEYADDLWNQFFRTLLSTMVVTKAFGDKPLLDRLDEYRDKFERASGTNFKAQDKD